MNRCPCLFAFLLTVCAALTSACSKTNEQAGTDSATHWLLKCDRDADCGDLACLCGVCTRECESGDSCEAFDPQASCLSVSDDRCEDTAQSRVCGLTCDSDAQCGNDARCEGGSCVRQPSSRPPGDAAVPPFDGAFPVSCDRQRADSLGECFSVEGWKWNGDRCEPVICSCQGDDCDDLFEDGAACVYAYAPCLQQPLERESLRCSTSGDCTLTGAECCGQCAPDQPHTVIALPFAAFDDYLNSVCPLADCLPSDETPPGGGATVTAVCEQGLCRAKSLSDLSECDSDEDCVVRSRDCCSCGANADSCDLIAISDEPGYLQLACDGGPRRCPQCSDDSSPDGAAARCRGGSCEVVFDGGWPPASSDIDGELLAVSFGAGQFVAVGTRGEAPAGEPSTGWILSSPDGQRWTERYAEPTGLLRDVAMTRDRWVAVGWDIWNTAEDELILNDVTSAAPGFVLVGQRRLRFSSDARSWAAAEP